MPTTGDTGVLVYHVGAYQAGLARYRNSHMSWPQGVWVATGGTRRSKPTTVATINSGCWLRPICLCVSVRWKNPWLICQVDRVWTSSYRKDLQCVSVCVLVCARSVNQQLEWSCGLRGCMTGYQQLGRLGSRVTSWTDCLQPGTGGLHTV